MSSLRNRARAVELEAARQRAPLTDRVNVEPPILNGMTASEAQIIGLVALVSFLLIGALVFWATGRWQFLLLLAVFGPAVVLWLASLQLARLKRGRPDAFYQQRMHQWLADRGLVQPKTIVHHGWWSLGRTLEFSLVSPLEPASERFDSPSQDKPDAGAALDCSKHKRAA